MEFAKLLQYHPAPRIPVILAYYPRLQDVKGKRQLNGKFLDNRGMLFAMSKPRFLDNTGPRGKNAPKTLVDGLVTLGYKTVDRAADDLGKAPQSTGLRSSDWKRWLFASSMIHVRGFPR